MLDWGGLSSSQTGSSSIDSGARSDPVNDAWIPTATLDAPATVTTATPACTRAPSRSATASITTVMPEPTTPRSRADPFILDGPDPPLEKVEFYLVTGVSAGIESSLGTNGAGVERPNTSPCP